MQDSTQAARPPLVKPELYRSIKGFTWFSSSVFAVQVPRIVQKKSASHAVALITLHAIFGRARRPEVSVDLERFGFRFGVKKSRAGEILADLEEEKVVKIKRRRMRDGTYLPLRVSFTKEYATGEPPRDAGQHDGWRKVQNADITALQLAVIEETNHTAWLAYLYLKRKRYESRGALAGDAGLDGQQLKRSIVALEGLELVRRDGEKRGGMPVSLLPIFEAKKGSKTGTGTHPPKRSNTGTDTPSKGSNTGMDKPPEVVKYRTLLIEGPSKNPASEVAARASRATDCPPAAVDTHEGEGVSRSEEVGAADFPLSPDANNGPGEDDAALAALEAARKMKVANATSDEPDGDQESTFDLTADYYADDGELVTDDFGDEAVFSYHAWITESEGMREDAAVWAREGRLHPKLCPPPSWLLKDNGEEDDEKPRAAVVSDLDALDPVPVPWTPSEGFLEVVAVALDERVDEEALGRTLAKHFDRLQAARLQASDIEATVFDEMIHAESLVRTVGRVCGAWERGDVRTDLNAYLASALDKNDLHWRKAGYKPKADEDDRFRGAPRYGWQAADAITEEIEDLESEFNRTRLHALDGLTSGERARVLARRSVVAE